MTRSTADTIVVGGGLIGCALAAELRERGQSVLVLERGEPGAEASSAAAGLLSPQSDARARDALFELGAESLALYPGWTARLSEETGVDCGFRRAGLLRCAFSETERESLAAAYGWQGAEGLGVELRSGEALERDRDELSLAPGVRAALLFADEAAVNPRALTRAAWLTAERRGAAVRAGVAVRRFVLERGRCVGVETDEGAFTAGAVVDAAGAWAAFDLGLPFPVPVRPVRGQIVALRVEGLVPARIVCSEDVYVLPRADGTVLIGSTLETVGFRKGSPREPSRGSSRAPSGSSRASRGRGSRTPGPGCGPARPTAGRSSASLRSRASSSRPGTSEAGSCSRRRPPGSSRT